MALWAKNKIGRKELLCRGIVLCTRWLLAKRTKKKRSRVDLSEKISFFRTHSVRCLLLFRLDLRFFFPAKKKTTRLDTLFWRRLQPCLPRTDTTARLATDINVYLRILFGPIPRCQIFSARSGKTVPTIFIGPSPSLQSPVSPSLAALSQLYFTDAHPWKLEAKTNMLTR